MSDRSHQVAVRLDSQAFESLKRLADKNQASYATVISMALACLENTTPASPTTSAALVIFARLSPEERKGWRKVVVSLRADGLGYGEIGKRLYRDHRLVGNDNFPLSPSTIRGLCSF